MQTKSWEICAHFVKSKFFDVVMREWIVLFKRPAFAEVAISVNNHSDYSIKMKGELKAYMN